MKLLPETTERQVQFSLSVQPGCQVFVAGTFNNWNPTANPMKDNPGSGHCKATLSLAAGRHEYKFVVNGVWIMDSNSTDWALDGYGSLNSVLHV
jgi:1,4-alpha-glucan branching enzyme